ncbi:MAG: phosphotransferase [Candidatus Taylorbacteria bacterium]
MSISYKHLLCIETEYGLIGPLSSKLIHDGPDNYVYVVVDANNNKYALRVNKRAGKNISFEMAILTVFAQIGFSAPRLLRTKSKEYFSTIDKVFVVLFIYIEGIQIKKISSEHLETGIIERGAKKLGELHRLTNGMMVEIIPTRTIFTEFDRLLKINISILERFKDVRVVIEQVKFFYHDALLRINSKKDLYGVIHNDYRVQNLIYTKDDCYIIDFDWSCYGPLSKDLGLAIAEWSMYTGNTGPSQEMIERFIKAYNETAPQVVLYNKDLIYWICFACLSDTCTFLADVVEGGYADKVINDVDQCYMYRKFKYFYGELK